MNCYIFEIIAFIVGWLAINLIFEEQRHYNRLIEQCYENTQKIEQCKTLVKESE